MGKLSVKWLTVVLAVEGITVVALLAWAIVVGPAKRAEAPGRSTTANSKLATPEIVLQPYLTGLTKPIDIAAPKDSTDQRLFVAQQTGVIRAFDKTGTAVSAPFLDISSKVQHDGEMGLLGLTFHPKYATNGFLYVNYVDRERNTVIARYKASPQTGVADPGSEKVLLKLKQPYTNHNGGALSFGPDGYLYVALGDGGSGGDPDNRAQNKGDLLGKLLRLDIDTETTAYAIPATNPFAGQEGAKGEIWAWGLRNPWKISFDRTTGDLYIADVGQGKTEELNFQKRSSKGGENYGWRCYEGTSAFNTTGCQPKGSYVAPVIEYDHNSRRCSVTGGYVYRGTAEKALAGKYFYADYCGGQLYYAERRQDKIWKPVLALESGYQVSTFGEDYRGELYLGVHDSGTIYRITDTANN